MLTRAIVVEVGEIGTEHEYKLKVRMPIINGIVDGKGSTADADLSWASIMYIPGLNVQYRKEDIVIVGFEDNNLDYPLVLGHLRAKGNDVNKGARISGDVQTLMVEDRFVAPTDVILGKTAYSAIFDNINDGSGTISKEDQAKLDGFKIQKVGDTYIISYKPQAQ